MSIEGVVGLNFGGCALGAPGQLETGVIIDHQCSVIKAYSKLAGDGLAIKTEIVVLLEGALYKQKVWACPILWWRRILLLFSHG